MIAASPKAVFCSRVCIIVYVHVLAWGAGMAADLRAEKNCLEDQNG